MTDSLITILSIDKWRCQAVAVSLTRISKAPHSTVESRLACLCHIGSVTPVLSGDLGYPL